eukprot:TRINITY_DN718_c0_g1_i1.p1 TRINITY_DN718_c0_g1~~TRINITY_DN718_c0_g1_i1.p1  ORF type:complete len:708 (+),score=255.58 TRINITY_DN718_c0_g1_i1:59-2125(+)
MRILAMCAAPLAAVAVTPAEQAAAMLKRMNRSEMVQLLHGWQQLGADATHPYVGNTQGVSHLGIPWLALQDGPQGYRDGNYGKHGAAPGTSTQWPSDMTIGATWDPALAQRWGAAMAQEFYAKGANVQLGPGLNVARVPQNGRGFEYVSGEDPYLGGEIAYSSVKGIQSAKVMATAKHYILNSQETKRKSVSSAIDERTLMEIYAPPFARAVDAGVASIMCSYNKINGTYACENDFTLNTVLKGWLGFEGFVMSDWDACHSTTDSVKAGLDQEMPLKGSGTYFSEKALAKAGVTDAEVERMTRRVLTSMYAVGVIGDSQSGSYDVNATSAEHRSLAQELAVGAATLLKNDGLLPLRKGTKVAVIGELANCEAPTPSYQPWAWPPTIGCLNSGGGSGAVVPSHVVSVLEGVSAAATTVYANGSDTKAAAAAAAAADVAVVAVGTTSTEGQDRASLSLPDEQVAYVKAVAAAQKNTVVVVMSPGPLIMDWADSVSAAVMFYMPGQMQGSAVSSVLFGDANPSGKLTFTMPRVENEMQMTQAQYPGENGTATYSERLEVGYRWYNAHPEVKPMFPFGHGLSYTTFRYSDLTVSGRKLSLTLQNTGGVAGSEVVQLYLTFPAAAGEPPRQLKRFSKVPLAPGASARVSFELQPRDLSVWDVSSHSWVEVSGTFSVDVGSSVEDVRLRATLPH